MEGEKKGWEWMMGVDGGIMVIILFAKNTKNTSVR